MNKIAPLSFLGCSLIVAACAVEPQWSPEERTGIQVSAVKAPTPALDVSYDNTTSGLASTNAQKAIDELASRPGVVGPPGPPGQQGIPGPGLGCTGDNAAPTCQQAETVELLTFGNSVTFTGTLPSGGSGDHWYRVSWTIVSPRFDYQPHIYLASGNTEYVFDLFRTCSGGRFYPGSCNGAGAYGGLNSENWNDDPGDYVGYIPCVKPGEFVYVRVRPLSLNLQCSSYTLVVQNGGV